MATNVLPRIRSRVNRLIPQFTFVWRWVHNFDRALRQGLDHGGDQKLRDDIAILRREGILVRRAEEVFTPQGLSILEECIPIAEERLQDEGYRVAPYKDGEAGKEDFFFHLIPDELELASPFARLSLDPRLLMLVNGYLGMKAMIRTVQLWLNVPTSIPAIHSQLWHRDYEDHLILKVFIYLKDVDEGTGPFSFVPGTQRGTGARRSLWPANSRRPRATDDEMAVVASPDSWSVCTGPARTVVLAATTGWHKGMKPVTGERVLIHFDYTSGRPKTPPSTSITASSSDETLTPDQRYAMPRQ